ncbi:MAG TPA: FYDLN acid domain-containing protein [Fredinandcohnia sp.]|nr:FYDLN acid domain-containing protein [Fredinandcohnia sp.]
MSRPTHLGTRYACWQCGTKFYDLNKPEPACPKCGADPREAPKAHSAAEAKPPRKIAPTRIAEDEAEVLDEEEEEFEGDDFEDADDLDALEEEDF